MSNIENNPWVEQHIAAETDFQQDPHGRNARRVASAIVRNEFAEGEPPFPCVAEHCDGTMWYRATIGAMKCPTCDSLAMQDGELISDKSVPR